jgi:hypothetical protein
MSETIFQPSGSRLSAFSEWLRLVVALVRRRR